MSFSSQEIDIRTDSQGLIGAGNVTNLIADPGPIFFIEGVHGIGQYVRLFVMVGHFAVMAGIGMWGAVTACVVPLPEVDGLGWEYVERDLFGRGSDEDAAGIPASATKAGDNGSTFAAVAQHKSVERKESQY